MSFLDEEEKMLIRLEEEKKPYLHDSQSHPDYDVRWKEFFSLKSKEREAKHQPPPRTRDIMAEWVDEWKAYFFKICEQRKRESTNKLLNAHHLMRKQVMDYERNNPKSMAKRELKVPYAVRFRPPITKPATAVGVDSRTSLERGSSSKTAFDSSLEAVSPEPMRESGRDPSRERSKSPAALSQISDESLSGQTKNDSKRGSSTGRGGSVSSAINVADEATVIGTLRLLSALENMLDELGGHVIAALGRANSMEVNLGYGKSDDLVNDSSFFR